MKLSLTKKPLGPCPPDGYRYVFPDDGWVAHAWCYTDWINEAQAHLRANGKDIPPDLAEQMEHQLCQGLEPGWCNYDQDNRPRPTLSLSWGDVVGALETFGRWITGGMQFVDQEEADRRALICSRCYLNTPISGCSGCQKMIKEVVGNCNSKYDYALKACGVCKCVLKAMVHLPAKILLESKSDQQKEMYCQVSHCWLNPNGENFRG